MVANILIIGSNGQVARNLKKIFGENSIALSRNELDLSNTSQITTTLDRYNPNIIINAAAYTQVDKAEEEFELANSINAIAPGIIAEYSRQKNIMFIHYSTDYVFEGNTSNDLKEDDITNPISNYGETKLAGERNIIQAGGKYLILRTSGVFDSEGHNFVKTMLRLGSEREELKIVNDQSTSPTYAYDLAKATKTIIDTAKEDFISSIYHICNNGKTTWYEFAKTIFELADKYNIKHNIKNIIPITSAEYPLPAKRPKYSVLNCSKLDNDYKIKLRDWKSALEEAINIISKQQAS